MLTYPKQDHKARQPQTAKTATLPAPTAGLKASLALMGEGNTLTDALFMFNMIPRELGCAVRPGSQEAATNLPDSGSATAGQVRTLITFESVTGTTGLKRFAVTDLGIYDITATSEGPWVAAYLWLTPGGNAGWGNYISATNSAGVSILLLCDEVNGFMVYDGGTNTWAPGTVSGPAAVDLVYVAEWQSRIWFIERDSTTLYYTSIGAFDGLLTSLDIGSRLTKGGFLKAMADWTLDDGSGMNDRLLVISSGGDLLAFAGINPDSSTEFYLDGRWFVGAPPEGRRVLSEWGGDVMILTTFGLLQATALAASSSTFKGALSDDWASKDIYRYFRVAMDEQRFSRGWGMELVPEQGLGVFMVPNPPPSSFETTQFVLNVNTGTWCRFRGLDMVCGNKGSAGFYFGTSDGRVLRLIGNVDNLSMTGAAVPYNGDPIKWNFLTHYDALGNGALNKIPMFIRSNFISTNLPTYDVAIRFDFDLDILSQTPQSGDSGLSEWDEALWDAGIWAGGLSGHTEIRGVGGIGFQIAVSMAGESTSETSLLGYTLTYEDGGIL